MDDRRLHARERPSLFHAGWLIDGTGSPVRRNVLLRVAGGRFAGQDPAPAPSGARHADPPGSGGSAPAPSLPVVDLSGSTVLPALVDAHAHLFMSGTGDPETRKRQLEQPYASARPAMARRLLAHLRHGVLAVRDGGDHAGHGLRFRDERSGGSPPVRVRSPGRAWRAPGRYGALIGRPPPPGSTLAAAIEASLGGVPEVSGAPETLEGVSGRRPGVPDHVKIVQSGLNSLLSFARETPPQFSTEDLSAAVRAAGARGLPAMVHANGRTPVRQALEAGCLSVEHGFFMGPENLARMAESSVTWVPTVFTMAAYAALLEPGSRQADTARRTLDHQMEQLALARSLGVATATGTDAGSLGVHHGAALKEEIRLFLQAGYSVEEAIRCATAVGARLLALQEALGTLVPGMPATFLVVAGSPRDLPGSLNRLDALYVDGRRLDLAPLGGEDRDAGTAC